jgi:N-6 DNA Methylase
MQGAEDLPVLSARSSGWQRTVRTVGVLRRAPAKGPSPCPSGQSLTDLRDDYAGVMELVRSKQRVADHGEVFTPGPMVEAMLDLVKDESERIDSRFLEPACGSGNFLVPVLKRKLATAQTRYGKNLFEMRHHSLLALMSIYGVELLEDNVGECRENLLDVFADYLKILPDDEWYTAASEVLRANIVHGDALSMTTRSENPQPITFPEWSYVGKGTYRRRDFRFDTLTQTASFGVDDSLFADLGKHEIFAPTKDFPPLSVRDIAGGGTSDD